MLSLAKLFRLLTESVFVLLGVLLVWVAMTGRYFFPRRAPAWIGLGAFLIYLGAFLIYWGLRAGWRTGQTASPRESLVRGASLALVGAMMLGIAWLPFAWVAPLLGAAGAILVLRGLVTAVLVARSPG